jgi:hypothetical protein
MSSQHQQKKEQQSSTRTPALVPKMNSTMVGLVVGGVELVMGAPDS